MPNVVGQPLDLALRRVRRATGFYRIGFPPVVAARRPLLASYAVVKQWPWPGTDVREQSNGFRLPGLTASAAAPPDQGGVVYLTVPDVYNLSPGKARAILEHVGFSVRVTQQTRRYLGRPGTVVGMQAPRAGASLERGRVVGLFLSPAKRHP